MTPEQDRALDMWKAGEPTCKITEVLGYNSDNTTTRFISQMRAMNEPRAVRRLGLFGHGGVRNMKDARATAISLMHRRRRNRKLPKVPVADIERAVAQYSGPITVCKPGFHMGHTPAWIRNP